MLRKVEEVRKEKVEAAKEGRSLWKKGSLFHHVQVRAVTTSKSVLPVGRQGQPEDTMGKLPEVLTNGEENT